MNKHLEQLRLLIIIMIIIILGQFVGLGNSIPEALVGSLIIIVFCFVSLKIKEALPGVKIPAFAWAVILGFIFTVSYNPLSEQVLYYLNKINFLFVQ